MRFFKFIFISLFGKEMEVCVEVKNFKIMILVVLYPKHEQKR